ncbi:peptide deformylase, partial [Patescibacteria group bacterium]
RVLINPVLIKTSHEKDLDWEGCLSIPDTYALVERPIKIKIEAHDVHGKKFKLKAKGFFARVIQHEIDHLDGRLITDSDKLIGKTLTQKEFDKMIEQKANM